MIKEYDYPVCFNFPVGHVKNNWPMLGGMSNESDSNRKRCCIKAW